MLVGLVPQTAGDLLYLETVGAECAAADASPLDRKATVRRCWRDWFPASTCRRIHVTCPKGSGSASSSRCS